MSRRAEHGLGETVSPFDSICRTLPTHLRSPAHTRCPQSPADGQLFLVKHLLTFREQIAPFDADFVAKNISLDFNTTKGTVPALSSTLAAEQDALLTRLVSSFVSVQRYEVSTESVDGDVPCFGLQGFATECIPMAPMASRRANALTLHASPTQLRPMG